MLLLAELVGRAVADGQDEVTVRADRRGDVGREGLTVGSVHFLRPDDAHTVVHQALTRADRLLLEATGEVDVDYAVPGVGTFTGQVRLSEQGPMATLHLIHSDRGAESGSGSPERSNSYTVV